MEIKVALVLMASGAGRRFGANKLLQTVDGLPLADFFNRVEENLAALATAVQTRP